VAVEVVVVDTPGAAAERAATLLAAAARAGTELVLAGGATPRNGYVAAPVLRVLSLIQPRLPGR
jgi:hypothetical protein